MSAGAFIGSIQNFAILAFIFALGGYVIEFLIPVFNRFTFLPMDMVITLNYLSLGFKAGAFLMLIVIVINMWVVGNSERTDEV